MTGKRWGGATLTAKLDIQYIWFNYMSTYNLQSIGEIIKGFVLTLHLA